MKDIILKIIFIIWLTAFTSAYACEDPLRMIRVGNKGIDGQISKKILDHAGCQVDIIWSKEEVNLDRRMAMLELGQIDMIIALNKLPEREERGNFSEPFDIELIRLWARKADQTNYANKTLRELLEEGARIVGPANGWYGPEYDKLREESHPQLLIYNSISHGMTLLHRNRADLFLGSEDFADLFPVSYQSDTVMLPQIIHEDGFHFMFSTKTVSEATIMKINQAIESLSLPAKSNK